MKYNNFTAAEIIYLKKHYSYNSLTGKVYRIKSDGSLSPVGFAQRGYIKIGLRFSGNHKCPRKIFGHRLAWLLHYGSFPVVRLDHIDRNGLNNKIDNLRLTTPSDNAMNSGKHNNNSKSIYRGVSWSKRAQKWMAYIYKNNKHIYIGSFKDEKEAARAYIDKALELYPGIFHAYTI
jgi:hypothetical protein